MTKYFVRDKEGEFNLKMDKMLTIKKDDGVYSLLKSENDEGGFNIEAKWDYEVGSWIAHRNNLIEGQSDASKFVTGYRERIDSSERNIIKLDIYMKIEY